MKRARRRLVWAAAIIVMLAGAAWWTVRSRVAEVTLVSPTRGEVVRSLAIIGRVAAPAEVRFAAREPTAITQTPVDEGAHVDAGQLLVHMDDAEALAMVAQAQAALAQAQAQTREVRTVTSKTAVSGLKEAKAQLETAKRTAERDEKLFATGNLTAAELDQSRTALTVAQTRKRSAELAAAATSKNGAQWQAALAAETFAEAGLVAARSRVERLSVLAPAPGIVTERVVEVGEVVQPGTALLTLVLDGPLRLVIEPDEKNLALLEVGQRARASVEAFPDQSFEAVLEYIAPAVDPARGTIEVRLAVPDPPDYLKTDMTVSVEVVIEEKPDGLTLPASAVVDVATDTPWVVVFEQGRAVRRTIEVGFRNAETVEILGGLDASDQVVALPGPTLEAGQRLEVIEE